MGCDGIPYSGTKFDQCGVCGGDNECFGCDGIPNSRARYDDCGVCNGNNSCFVSKKDRKSYEDISLIWGIKGIDRSTADLNNVRKL